MLSVQQSPNDKSGLGFKSNIKNKSKNNNNKKGQVQVKDPAKIVCFKCNIEGHHVRSCPLKKKQKGKRPQAQTHIQPQVEEMPLPKKKQANAPIVEKSSEKKEKKRTCYICREKGHISSLCTIGTSSNSITIDDVYSLQILVRKYSRNWTKSTPGSYFATELPRPKESRWGGWRHRRRGPGPGRAGLWCGPLVPPLDLPFRLQIASVAKPPVESHDTENLPETPPPPIPSRGIQEIAGTLPERGFISGGLYTAMVASGVMSE
ncbi:hypothetical protein QYE76_023716 [Lolium multiflorum]|uniref:CCHC-type domain-containing protein n=1 Tax=Lolium multiflorum TaxID=4521 RepID=A0AAD8VT11_LOLMU|nr:hypothetical protein QYE76_023716 [Lolium multiflorum]